MGLLTETLGTLTIASGQTTSNRLGSVLSDGQLKTALGFLDALSIYSPQGLAEDIEIQVSPVKNPTASDWVNYGLIDVGLAEDILTEASTDLQDESDVVLETESLGSGGVTTIEDQSFRDLRLVASSAVAADRDFVLLGKLLIGASD